MDSVSQAAFGSVIAVVACGGRQPRRAALTGALLGTLPDLDVLVPQATALEAMINHRSWSHSWLVQTLVSPLFAWVFHRLDRWRSGNGEAVWTWRRWLLVVWLVFVTHSVLDGLTIYGTWLFWPFGDQPVMGGSTFIIDPLFTLPLLIGLGVALRAKNLRRAAQVAGVALFVSCGYLLWGFAAQQHIESRAEAEMARQGLSWDRLVATPTPFNSVLWRIVALDGDHFHEGFYSFIDGAPDIRFTRYPRNPALLDGLETDGLADRFSNFNHGYFAMKQTGGSVVGQDLRMGSMPYFFFAFEFGRSNGDDADQPVAVPPREWTEDIDERALFGWLIQRFRNPDLPPLVPGSQ